MTGRDVRDDGSASAAGFTSSAVSLTSTYSYNFSFLPLAGHDSVGVGVGCTDVTEMLGQLEQPASPTQLSI